MKINGKEVNLRFGMLSVEMFFGEADSMSGLSYYSSIGLAKIIWSGIVNYYDVKELPRPVTFEEVYNHIEDEMLNDSDLEDVKAAIKQFEESQALKKKTEQIREATEEIKKKLVGQTQESQPTQPD
jgi:hypothetical protein